MYNNQVELRASGSITLLPGFTVPAGSNLLIHIVNFPLLVSSPSANQNYISTRIFKVAGVNSSTIDQVRNVYQENQSIQYFDGLGRPLQTVGVHASPTFKDIVQVVGYDGFGRESTKYLPYTDQGIAGGAYKSNALTSGQGVLGFYASPTDGIQPTNHPFSRTVFEASPLNRVTEQGAPGTAWQPGSSRNTTPGTSVISYGTNNTSLLSATTGNAVRLWTAVAVTTADHQHERLLVLSAANNGLYAANQLYLTTQKDENWVSGNEKRGTTEEYKDKEGRVVLKRTFNLKAGTTEVLSTYYVYDNLGNLSFVLPPGANPDASTITSTLLEDFCYQYRYDGRNRLIEKKVPGKGWENIVYNLLDQVVFTQDAVQQAGQERSFIKYDALGRVIMTGIETGHTSSRSAVQISVNNLAPHFWDTRTTASYNLFGYDNLSAPANISNIQVKTVNYYDDYAITSLPAGSPYNQNGDYSSMTKGLLTASLVNVLGTGSYLWNMNYYDDKGQVVKSINQHYKGGQAGVGNYGELTNTYSFASELTLSERKHKVGGIESLYVKNKYEYDHQGRRLDVSQTTGTNSSTANAAVILSRSIYNELGQLKTKQLHSTNNGSSFAQSIEYRSNERGWLTSQTSALFNETLKYQETIAGVKAQYNGNISRQEWGTGQYYNYSYDDLNRLRSGISSTGADEKSVVYDQMGNISQLQRYNKPAGTATVVDRLRYIYTGNRLTSVQDSNTVVDGNFQLAGITTYGYNPMSGNLISRTNASSTGNNISNVVYNYLNLPSTLTAGGLNLTYVYEGNGRKLRKLVGGNSLLNNDYISGIQYEGGNLAFVQTEEGRAMNNQGVYSYEYTLSDHLGNGRVYFDISNGKASQIQVTDYYPFGLGILKSQVGTENKYQYNGKEKQDELKMLDYGARFYDPVVARWNVVDPLSNAYVSNSPYSYVLGNPVANTDVKGMWTVSRHHRMTLDALTSAGIGAKQASMIAWYASSYADNPGAHIALNNIVHPFNMMYIIAPNRNMSGSNNSQVTDWNPGINHQNYNIWHSMRSPWERENNSISEKGAMSRGMEWGWEQIFEASKGGKLSSLKEESSGVRQLGQGIHALQDAYAHKGTDMDNHDVWNDRFGDTSGAEKISNSAVTVFKLLSGDYAGLDDKINISTTGMSKEQLNSVMSSVKDYMNHLKKKREDKK